jgi:hypothetical protein
MAAVFLRRLGRLVGPGCLAIGALFPVTGHGAAPCDSSYLNPQNSYLHNTVVASTLARDIAPGEPLGSVTYSLPGEAGTSTLDEYLARFCTTGFLVLKDNQIVFERYLQGRKPTDGPRQSLPCW